MVRPQSLANCVAELYSGSLDCMTWLLTNDAGLEALDR